MVNKKESVWLHVTGDEYSAMVFGENCKVEEVYKEMVKKNLTSMTLDIEDTNIEVAIRNFGEVDESFVTFIKNNLCDYDQLKDQDMFRVNLEML